MINTNHKTKPDYMVHTSMHIHVLSCCRDVGMEMKLNAAYGPMSSIPQMEDTYEAV